MDKRYQVFVSSTFADLKEERRRVIQTLMEMDCIPAGMELFPAADEEQWAFIKKVIDDCDYYLLIIGGRYGSTTSDGISYTEKEYDYAVQKGMRVIALLHEDPDTLPVNKSDIDQVLRDRLSKFRDKVAGGRLVKFWKYSEDLAGLVALSLTKTIKTYPAVGWIRATGENNTELLQQINDLRRRNEELQKRLEAIGPIPRIDRNVLAQGEDKIQLSGTRTHRNMKTSWQSEASWNEIFSFLGPDLYQYQHEDSVNRLIAQYLLRRDQLTFEKAELSDDSLKTTKIQFIALGYLTVEPLTTVAKTTAQFWMITPLGKQILLNIRSIRRKSDSTEKKAVGIKGT